MSVQATGWAPIVKSEKQADGTLLVYGKVSDDTLDRDLQICDKTWLARAVPEWFADGGNIREQHSSIAAGVAVEHEVKADGHYVKARVVDPGSVLKVEHKVLNGFSIGIKRPRVTLDKGAPGGRIVDGKICEISLVDRPCNPTTLLSVVKSDSGQLVLDAPVDLAPSAADDLRTSIDALGLQVQAIATHVLGQKADLPNGAPMTETTKPAATDATTAAGDGTADAPKADATTKPAEPEFLLKTDAADFITKTDLQSAITEAVTKAVEPLAQVNKDLTERLAKVEALPAPGGPVITRTADQTAAAAALDKGIVKAEVDELLAKADAADSPLLAQGYRDRADRLAATL